MWEPSRKIGWDCESSGWRLLQIKGVEAAKDDWQTPEGLSQIARLHHSGPPDRVLRFENDQRINGREYTMALTDFVVPLAKVERRYFESSAERRIPSMCMGHISRSSHAAAVVTGSCRGKANGKTRC